MSTCKPAKTSLVAQLGGAFFFLVLSVVAVRVFLALFAPSPWIPPTDSYLGYSRADMEAQVNPEALRDELDTIADFGNRYLGSDGFYKTEDYLRKRYTDAGLELYEQDLMTAVPKTDQAEALLGDGSPAPFTIYPLLPNHLQPIVTPDEGITGTLIHVTDEVLAERTSFTDCIAVIDTSQPTPVGYGISYHYYAQLGFKGLIVTHSEGLHEFAWAGLDSMVTVTPVNYLRLVAEPAIMDHLDQEVTFHVRTRYQNTPNRTIIGVLKTGAGNHSEALVIPTSYDALSPLPDLAPGIPQALNVATQLKLLDGILPYRDELRRDVIFIAFGGRVLSHSGIDDLLRAIGSSSDQGGILIKQQEMQASNALSLEQTTAMTELFADDSFMRDRATTMRVADGLTPELRAVFDTQYQYVLNTLIFDRSELLMSTKIAFEKTDTTELDSPEFTAYQAAKAYYDDAFSAAGYHLDRLLETQGDFVEEAKLRDLMADRFSELQAFHQVRAKRLEQNIELYKLFKGYRNVSIVAPELTTAAEKPAKEVITYSMGASTIEKGNGQVMVDTLLGAINRLDLAETVGTQHLGIKHSQRVGAKIQGLPVESEMWCQTSYPAYSIVNLDRSYKERGYPIELPWMRNTETMEGSLKILSEAILSIAFGNGYFSPLQRGRNFPDLYGRVLASNVGQSIIPNHPLKNALVANKQGHSPANWKPKSGYIPGLMFFTDPYGEYHRYQTVSAFHRNSAPMSMDAVYYDNDGKISYIKDQGSSAQKIFRSTGFRADTLRQSISIVCFRATPVTLFDLTNPQNFESYSGIELIKRKGLSAFTNMHTAALGEGMITSFVSPEEYFYIKLKSGSADNVKVQTTRAFMLGVTDDELKQVQAQADADIRMGSEIRGQGYLANETEFLLDVPNEIAKSMLFVNEQRLKVQQEYDMADERTIEFHTKASELLKSALSGTKTKLASLLQARDAVTYATLNHPILLDNIYEAIAGILWYLGLLVPFVFFFEKLVFGFTDIRKQLTASVIIFLLVFLALWILHPAFSMIRSSVMILLGFIILLIATGIIFLFSSRFKENLEAIKKSRGRVTEAEVNKVGAIGTAFMLGLNNMHRRRVRTFLTCSTLILITFVLICFTSIQSNVVETSQAVGKAPYQGFLVKKEQYLPLQASELFSMRAKYGSTFEVVPRYAYFGEETWDTRERFYPEVEFTRKVDDRTRSIRPSSILRLAHNEPLAKNLTLTGRWFTKEQEVAAEGTVPIIISDVMARQLEIDYDDVADGKTVEVSGGSETFAVQGIFEGASLDGQYDLDGRNLMPFDIKALREINKGGGSIIADDEDPQLGGAEMVIAPLRPIGIPIPHGVERITSISVVLPDSLSYRESKDVIEQFMEQSGRSTYYGLDSYSFVGMRARQRSFTGMLDMLIPLIIAAITVLNTIRGSVYERKDEIFVYNAVGIAPVYVFFMFFAEAFVYAVVGSVLGFILSQGTGMLLTTLGLTGGLNMTFTSISTVYVSIIIMGVVLLSTLLPARTAKKIAAPAEDSGWKLPSAEGDRIAFRLPFTFNHRDRIGVLAFFHRYFADHGEGSSGSFFAGKPELNVAERLDPLANDALIPMLAVTVWLKPFDLGVSQRIEISLPTDDETGEFVAEISLVRLSGTVENWQRLNTRFISFVRRHFLHWRAVPTEDRQEMKEEAQKLLLTTLGRAPEPTPAETTHAQ